MVTLDNERQIDDVMKNFYKLIMADPSIKAFRVTPGRNLKEREEIRDLVYQAQTAKATEDFIDIVPGKQILAATHAEEISNCDSPTSIQ